MSAQEDKNIDDDLLGSDQTNLDDELDLGANPIPKGPVKRKTASDESVNSDITSVVPPEEQLIEKSENLADEAFSESQTSQFSKRLQSSNSRDLTVSSLLHLIGMPTHSQIGLLETKLDLILSKLSLLQSKVDRLQSQIELVNSQSPGERMEFQLTEIRSIMKKFFPDAFQTLTQSASPSGSKLIKAQVLTSSSQTSVPMVSRETSIILDNSEKSETKNLSDADYQALEASKLREESK